MTQLPDQRWQLAPSQPDRIPALVAATGLSPLLVQVLLNRGITTPEEAQQHVDPELTTLPAPVDEFPDLAKSVAILQGAIADHDPIVICGDYDADGMTSTALLIRALRHWGAEVTYAIPSRMQEGYGINERIVEDCANAGVGVILTVDNGIAAYDPIHRAVDLGISVIVTDHHDLPPKLPPADAILNPKLLPETSPYRTLAGVGVAYVLAVATGQALGQLGGLTVTLLDLCTLGTIADLAALTGVNRRWVKRGLKTLPQSSLAGLQALMQLAQMDEKRKPMRPDAIGFRLGPRINAVGRIGDPAHVIELLTTDDPEIALTQATECETTNRRRRQLCEQIEQEAVALVETQELPWRRDRVLVVYKPDWHHGVIGIVASRLVERYGVPVFICTQENPTMIRGSARSIPEFHVAQALDFCDDCLLKHGGHQAAGGFSVSLDQFPTFQRRLSEFAHQHLEPEHLKPCVFVDVEAQLSDITAALYQQIESLQPWGMGVNAPVFWSSAVAIADQRVLKGNHLKLKLAQGETVLDAIAWRWGDYFPLPSPLDVAYTVEENHWQGNTTLQLQLAGLRATPATATHPTAPPPTRAAPPPPTPRKKAAHFTYKNRPYQCSLANAENELRIKNDQGQVLAVQRGQRTGLLGESRDTATTVDVTKAHFYSLIKTAIAALEAD
ncbi:single-stranded-DNA-specific exonuclease RecJ [Spirulina major CS-329]|uniref:single-stranded-DNA-specific exonuclease RecJ n=1 Tax=Spirulina major TaxID=270636 RepID=UPI0023307C76|nr:single-stranded-DNA-specific exonuclease RecJ [Spirulina major]MDB9502103.1 single-stranded-DNA-specific exonuclease RecJ [Spirulina major CS-329]